MTPGARPLRWVPQAIGWLLTAVALVGPIRADEPAATAPGWHAEQHAASSRGIAVPLTVTYPGAPPGPMPLVAMAHGHGADRDEAGAFAMLAERLAAAGIASVRLDFPGCGESSEPFTANTLEHMEADLQAAIGFTRARWAVDPARVGLLGYSMGARVAMMVSAEPDAYRAIALWAPVGSNGADSMLGFVGGVEAWARLEAAARKAGQVSFTTRWGQQQALGLAWFEQLAASRPLDAIAQFRGALLVVHGSEDDVIAPAVGAAVVAAAANSRSVEHRVIAGADHGLGFYDDGARVAADVLEATAIFFEQTLARDVVAR